MYEILLIILVILVVILGISLLWMYYHPTIDNTPQLATDISNIKSYLADNSRLHRLLMIEINANRSKTLEIPLAKSETVTFDKISSGMVSFGESLIRSFGTITSQKIATLMQSRDIILREYYILLSDSICNSDDCHLTKSSSEIDSRDSIGSLDITTSTQRKLEATTIDIIDNISGMYHIKDKEVKNHPINHFQRLQNLIIMYNKELLNQAKFYSSGRYEISMNCGQSSQDITRYIADELSVIMKDINKKQVVPM